jgi:DNA-binding HxlR family transcriptional regulator
METGLLQETKTNTKRAGCEKAILPVRDALDVLSGKWKLQIILSLTFGNLRFKEMQRQIHGITAKMLSKELKELEINQLVKRRVYDTVPVTVEYSLTPYGRTLKKVIEELGSWGRKHRDRIIGKGR